MVRTGRSMFVVVLVVVAGLVLGACSGGDDGGAGVVKNTDTAEVEGVTVVPVTSANHVSGTVDYPTSPPAGGNHNGVWQNCGFYTEVLVPELAVHSLEHGAVWITYQPDVSDETKSAIEAMAATSDYVLASPYPGNPSPIVLTAWGRQAGVDSMEDPLVQLFLDEYLQDGPTTPEPGAACSGAVGVPPDQPNSLIR